MRVPFRSLAAAIFVIAWPALASAATLFRLFLLDGSSVVSYGDYVRVQDEVIFSMPIGGPPEQPQLQVTTLPAAQVDWTKTEHYAESARYAQYATTFGEQDFARLSNEVAGVLNEVATSPDKARAIALAEEARRVLAAWPATHYGYRQNDVRDILSLVDGALAGLRGTPTGGFALSLSASTLADTREPLLPAPTPREQIEQLVRVAGLTARSADREVLLQTALARLAESATAFPAADAATLRTQIETQLHEEQQLDSQYNQLSQKLLADAHRAAASARVALVERTLDTVAREDDRLGSRRPEVIQALRAAIAAELDAARQLRLRRDQWLLHRDSYREYQRQVGVRLLRLIKAQPQLDAIRRLQGPPPAQLTALRRQLAGGADRLQVVRVPEEMRAAHDMLVSAWRFAEHAVDSRYQAVSANDIATAWAASSSAAGALMLLSNAQQQIRTLLEFPTAQ